VCSSDLGPIVGIIIFDYFIIRKTNIDIDALYEADGPFKGVNWRAMVALFVAIIPNLPGFINAATNTAGTASAKFPPFFDNLYNYAWFVGLFLAMAIYGALMSGQTDHNDSPELDPRGAS